MEIQAVKDEFTQRAIKKYHLKLQIQFCDETKNKKKQNQYIKKVKKKENIVKYISFKSQ